MDLVPGQQQLLLLLMLLLSTLLLWHRPVGALRLLNVTAPTYIKSGSSARLECKFELDSDRLYFTVAWYKDNDHIYSYSKKSGKKLTFSLAGVDIDDKRSNSQLLYLRNVNLNSSGSYACEVNIAEPPFKVVKDEAYMEVIVPPREDPKITGEEKIYASGDVLALNCTSDYSYPPAQLQWFINDIPVEPNSKTLENSSRGLSSIHSSLRLVLNPLHLTNERIEVKCESTVHSKPIVNTPYVDKRITKIYVQGHASLSTPSALLLFSVLLIHALTRSKGL